MSLGVCGRGGARQKHNDSRGSRTGPALSSPLPGTALQPKGARRAGGGGAGPTLTWRLCSPSRQAEIKATGVSLVGFPGARTPRDPKAPASSDPALARPLCEWDHTGGWAHSSPGTWVGPVPHPPQKPRPRAGVPGLLWEMCGLSPASENCVLGLKLGAPRAGFLLTLLPLQGAFGFPICKMGLALPALTTSQGQRKL